ncbi:MAG: O-antigen ligase family protein [Planctomycetaceae bacterium]|nr:O-antigen ligase family protein [Planctomycetaceae bacterium]
MQTAAETVLSADSQPASQVVAHGLLPVVLRTLDRLVDLGLAIVLFVVPFTMAGIRETGVAVFVCAALTMSVAWAVRELLQPQSATPMSVAFLIPAAAAALVFCQLIPLPAALLERLSPFTARYLPVWNTEHFLFPDTTRWSRLSLTPSLTQSGLVLLVAYGLFFLTLTQRIRSARDIDRVLKCVCVTMGLMGLVALGQLFFPNDRYLWTFEYPFRPASWPAKGTFTNQNHFAHFLALGIGPLLWWWKSLFARSADDRAATSDSQSGPSFGSGSRGTLSNRQMVLTGIVVMVAFAAVLSLSRAGILAFGTAALISVLGLGIERRRILLYGLPALLFVGAALLTFGTDSLQDRVDTVVHAQSLQEISPGRFQLWSSLLRGLPHFWMAGAGVGSHAYVYPVWMETDPDVRFSHAESGYLQVLVETGVPGLVLVVAALLMVLGWSWRAWRRSRPGGPVRIRVSILTAGIVVSAGHAFVDFAWYVPACTIFVAVLAACLCRLSQMTVRSRQPATRWPVAQAFAILLLAAPVTELAAEVVFADAAAESSWLKYRRDIVEAGREDLYDSPDALDERLDRMIASLEECLHQDPSQFPAMSELATLYLRRFEHVQAGSDNPMSLREIKNTVETAEFESPQQIMEWLEQAFGPHVIDLYRGLVMAERAVSGHPLRGETYLNLAQLGFLKGMPASAEARLVEQAVLLRPSKPPVLYFAGMVEAERGQLDKACEWWKKAWHQSLEIRPLILAGLDSTLTPREIVWHMSPGERGLWEMFVRYRVNERPDAQRWIASYYASKFAEVLETHTQKDASFWLRAADIFEFLPGHEQAVKCLEQAVAAQPSSYDIKKRYALALQRAGHSEQARSALEWCLMKRPEDLQVIQALQPEGSDSAGGGVRGI